MKVILDASALLAYLQGETGEEIVEEALAESIISSVNWSEVLQKSIAAGVEVGEMLNEFQSIGLLVEAFTSEDAELTAQLWKQTKSAGLSLGDRACLSLGLRMKLTVLTADRAWTTLKLPFEIKLIRD